MTAIKPIKETILLIGNDDRLVYLLQRFVEQGGWTMVTRPPQVSGDEVLRMEAGVVIFDSIDQLRDAQLLVDDLAENEVPVLVCASLVDESAAGELGADACLLHPLTYDQFYAALRAVYSARQY